MPRSIEFATRFPRAWRRLTSAQRERVIDIVGALPELLKNPHQHSGFGVRRVKGTGLHEIRLDLRWRLVIVVREESIVLYDVLNHDQVRRL